MIARVSLLTLLLCVALNTSAQQKPSNQVTVIYVYDALCGWCYGFSPVIQQLQQNHPDITIEVLSGGMITGDRIGPLIDVAPYIRSAYKDVENASGVKFGQPFLEELFGEAQMYMTSIPAARALAAFRILQPDGNQLRFAARIQKAIYGEGMHPDDEDGFGNLVTEFGLDKARFLDVMRSDDAAKAADADMQRSSQMGVTGFPTVFVQHNNQLSIISRGYKDYASLEQSLQGVVSP